MTGPWTSVIGVKREPVIQRFLTGLPQRFEPAAGPAQINAAFLTVDGASGKALTIERIRIDEPAQE